MSADLRPEAVDVVDLNAVFPGSGEMSARMRAMDWSRTPLGPVEQWSPALRMVVRLMLANRFPHLLWWGPEYIQFYNDPYREIPGTKHPAALAQAGRDCWPEIWHVIGPLVDTPFHGGPPAWNEDICLEINRHGFIEETHFTFAYSAVPDETMPGGVGGVLATVHEITDKVVGERRVGILRDLGTRVGDAKTAEAACAIAARTLALHDKDIPFVLLYLFDQGADRARLAGAAGVEAGAAVSPAIVDLDGSDDRQWSLTAAIRHERLEVVDRLSERFADVPCGPWSDPPESAVVVPIPSHRAHAPAGVMVAGISARLAFDAHYQDFLELVRTQIATSIANARAYEEEKKRAEALAEIDRAKTEFFSNVSHEFRTPLTLILGPIDDALADSEYPLLAPQRKRVDLIRRSAQRLQKLVNTLLDFSRIEAGRAQASFAPADLPALTVDLASSFRSAVETAGLTFDVSCPPLPEAVYVDASMWEKILLNLLSNAFKFTLTGGIRVRLSSDTGGATLSVEDTGTGISAEELPRVFDRFHRVENARGRSHEGTGIGLALVRELVSLHGGAIDVESAVDRGSRFRVRIPFGSAHLPAERLVPAGAVATTSAGAHSFLAEASQWNAGPDVQSFDGHSARGPARSVTAESGERPRILVVDDNADMREYVRSILVTHWNVDAVSNGAAALAAVRDRAPDLIVSDIMMPGLNGLQLLAAVRRVPETRLIPVILLSARAGKEATIYGLRTGADDYLVKPFAASELIARVNTHLEMARLRKEAVEAREEMLAAISHDLQGPLAAIDLATSSLLRASPTTELGREQRAQLERIQRASGRMEELVANLLDVSRLDAGRFTFDGRFQPVDALVRRALDVAEPLAAKMKVAILSTVEPSLTVRCDAHQTLRVLANVFDNAIKFSPPGGSISFAVSRSNGAIRFEVRDCGPGVAADDLPRIFDRYWQARRENRTGSGLGLSIAKGLIENQSGRIWVESESGHGAAFFFELPAP